MKEVNLIAVRERLPRGSINLIAEKLGIAPVIVSHVLRNGWYSEYRDRVLELALSIIKGNNEASKSMIKEADSLGLTTTSLFPIHKKSKAMKEQSTITGKPGFADLFSLDREGLEDYIKVNALETNPDDFNSFWKGEEKNRINLIYAICEELEMGVPDWDEIHNLDREDMIEVIDDMDLGTNPDDFDDDEELANEICGELGIEEPEEEQEEEQEEE
jgi:hypothetical protein